MPANFPENLDQKKLEIVLSAVKEGVIFVDPTGFISYMNPVASLMAGVPFDNYAKLKLGDVLKIYDAKNNQIPVELFCPLSGIESEGVVYNGEEVKILDPTSGFKVVTVVTRKFKGAQNINLGAIITIENVHYQTELERMKLDFVAMSVHILRTPVAVMRGYLSILLKDATLEKLNEQEISALTNTTTSADDLANLVENLLDFSELQSGELKMHLVPIDLENTVASIVAEFAELAASKNIYINYFPAIQKLPFVKADVLRIKEVLRNLIGNAVKYTDVGGIEITLGQINGFLETIVADSGVGIDEENLGRIFDKFYRIKPALSMENGAGLGLYISKKIIEAHKGKIWAESIVGKGSAFHFTLPTESVSK